MSIYTKEQLNEKVEAMDRDRLLFTLRKVIYWNNPKTFEQRLARLITGEGVGAKNNKKLVELVPGRMIKHSVVEEMDKNGMIDYAPFFVRAALEDRRTTSDIMVRSWQLAGRETPFYVTEKGIPKWAKTQVGYILTMAGFSQTSKYNRELVTIEKVWIPERRYKNLSLDLRMELVKSTIRLGINKYPISEEIV